MPRTNRSTARRPLVASAAIAMLGYGALAQALEFEFGEHTLRMENLITVGGLMRMQDRDPSLVGKGNMHPGICLRRDSGTPESGPSTNLDDNEYVRGDVGSACNSNNVAGVTQFNTASGSFTPNGDNGNLNFDRYDIVHATAKITTDLTANLYDFNVFVRGLYYFDNQYTQLVEYHPDTTLTPQHSDFSDVGEEEIGTDFKVLDYFVSRTFQLGERNVAFKLGNQVLNWGESGFLIANSLNSINPPNQALLRIPGFDIKELFQPVGMAYASADVFQGASLEAFYQYEWKPVVADPVGSFFSQSDTLGPGGSMAALGFGRSPEDYGFIIQNPTDQERISYPTGRRGFYRPIDTCSPSNINPAAGQNTPCIDSAGLFGSTASRSIFRDYAEEERRKPDDGGQYGAALKLFLDWLNGGTEVGLYYANYHSRFPIFSAIAAQETCISGAEDVLLPIGACGNPAVGSGLPAEREPLPLDTVRIIIEYPENIHLYGISFNTTVGDWALSGEYAYRPNLPMQVHSSDVVFAALQPALPQQDVSLGPAGTIPGRRTALPDFVMTNYRGTPPVAGQYIPGYERMKQGQADVTLLKTIGGDNPLGASQIVVLLEMGHTYVFDFPELSELQFNGAGTDTHISGGADGTPGINPRDIRTDPNDPSTNRNLTTLRANPQAHQDLDGFGTAQSYGYRFVTLTRFDSAFFGVNLELLNAFFHDVEGVGPGIGQNFVEGRKQILSGIRFDYLSKYNGEIRYTWFTGGGKRDQLRDRDNLLMFVGYQF
ncbi:MAG TPA: DUF1302 family protein [Solimonas sp.]|nr:DUF1302 family protein [Solimonas sp.]